MVIIRTCLKLGVPEEALQIAMDPVKYGMFPFKKGIHTLLLAFTERQDTEGVCGLLSSTYPLSPVPLFSCIHCVNRCEASHPTNDST